MELMNQLILWMKRWNPNSLEDEFGRRSVAHRYVSESTQFNGNVFDWEDVVECGMEIDCLIVSPCKRWRDNSSLDRGKVDGDEHHLDTVDKL